MRAFEVQTSGAKFEPFITRYPTDSADPLKAATQAGVGVLGKKEILRWKEVPWCLCL